MSNDEKLRLPHHRAGNFASFYANSTIMSGPSPEGMYYLVFSEDTISIEHEILVPVEGQENAFRPAIEDDSIRQFREDKARMAMTEQGLRNLYEMLEKRFGAKGASEEK